MNMLQTIPSASTSTLDASASLRQADAGPGLDTGVLRRAGDTSTRIDGNATNEGAQRLADAADGKPILVDPLHQDGDISIERERTLVADGRGGYYVSSDQLVLRTGDADDRITVANNSDGSLALDVNGKDFQLEMAAQQILTVHAGDGNDVIEVAPDVTVNMIVHGGAGDDIITTGAGDDIVHGGDGNDTIRTGAGNDYVEGGNGNDWIHAGAGNNVVYGGDGHDTLMAGNGDNYLDGGNGNDALFGGSGNNILSGGNGEDRFVAGTGSSHIYAGAGTATVTGTGGSDVIYGARDAVALEGVTGADTTVVNVDLRGTPGASIKVEGSDAFVQRVEADLAMLRSSPVGRQMLAEFDRAAAQENANSLTIRELANEDNGYTMPDVDNGGTWADTELVNGRAGKGDDAVIAYNPSFHMEAFPAPVGVLYHEMAHAWNAVTGTFQPGTYQGSDAQDRVAGVPNAERQAVGLENTGTPHDFDRNPDTPDTTANPVALSENGLRAEMGLPLRLHYAL